MLNFDNFLTESLNNPAEYYMTDDTVLPKRVYGMYSYDGMDYGISLEETNLTKIYEMKVYRVVNGKARYWKFKNANHMRVALATALKFTEATVPFIKQHMNGVFVRLAKDKTNERVQKLANAMVNRLFIKSFRSVPVVIDKTIEMPKSHIHQFIFFARKGVNPKTAFNAKMFKNYVFDMDGTIPAGMAMDIAPKKKSPVVYTSKQSRKYSFGKLELGVDYQISSELIDSLDKNLKPLDTDTSAVEKEKAKAKKDVEEATKKLKAAKKELAANRVDYKEFFHMIIQGDDKVATLEKVFAGAKDGDGYDMWTLQYFIRKMFDVWKENNQEKFNGMKSALVASTIIDGWDDTLHAFRNDMAQYGLDIITGKTSYKKPKEIDAKVTDKLKKIQDEIKRQEQIKTTAENVLHSSYISKKSTIKLSEFPVDIPGTGAITVNKDGAFVENTQNVEEKKNHIQKDMGMYQSWSNDLTESEKEFIRKYTGSSYKNYNRIVRRAAEAYIDGLADSSNKKSNSIEDLLEFEPVIKIMSAFTKIKSLPKGMWVYRTGYAFGKLKEHLEIGDDYLETGITSTTINKDMNFNSSNVRMAIYLPPGSKVIPVLDHDQSTHPSETEIILPPMSLFKIVEKNVQPNEYYGDDGPEDKHHLACVYKGAAFEDFLAQVKHDASMKQEHISFAERIIMQEQRKKTEEVGNKFGTKMASKETVDKVTKLIKSGKLKLDTKKGK